MISPLLLLFISSVQAHVLTPSYEAGKKTAGSGKEQIKKEMTSPTIESFGKETHGKGHIPTTDDLGCLTDSPVNSFFLDIYGKRQHFELDPNQDSLLKRMPDPLKRVDGALEGEDVKAEYTTHHCRETKLQPIVECEIHKDVLIHKQQVPVVQKGTLAFNHGQTQYDGYHVKRENPIFNVGREKPYTRHISKNIPILKTFLERHRGIDPQNILSISTENVGGAHEIRVAKRDRAFRAYKIHYSYQSLEEQKFPHVKTIDGCQAITDLATKGNYSLYSTHCLDKANPRIYEDVPVFEKCWREKRVYHANKTAKGNCESLRKQGCEQTSSRLTDGLYEQTYRCKSSAVSSKARNVPGQRPFCLTGGCEEITDIDDLGFDDAIAQMALIDELGKNAGKVHIFTGQSNSCKNTKFKQCCFKSSGIAIDTGFSSCGSTEKDLAKRRGKGLCVYIGKKSVTQHRIKIGYRQVYCCFPSKLLRVFQEQGRSQLRMGWGNAKHPQCRGLTIEEIQRLDFGQMDLSEAFDEVRERLSKISIPKVQSQMKQRLQQMGGITQ